MKNIALLLILIFITVSHAVASRNTKGVSRKVDRMSTLVEIITRTSRSEYTCSGVRIAHDKVLTVAHCFSKSLRLKSTFKVNYQNGKKFRTETIRISDVVIKSKNLDQELAIFTIHPKDKKRDYSSPQKIYDYESGEFGKGDQFIFAGYGINKRGVSGLLRTGTLKFSHSINQIKEEVAQEEEKVIEHENVVCDKENQTEDDVENIEEQIEAIEEVIQDENFLFEQLILKPLKDGEDELSKNQKYNQLPCKGDSGGPLFKRDEHGELILVALISTISGDHLKGKSDTTVCTKAEKAHYIPLSLHKDFLYENGITF